MISTDDIPVDYQPLTRNNDMDILINKLNKSVYWIDKSNEAINNIAVKHPIINPVESLRSAKTKILTQEIYIKIYSLISIVDTMIEVL